MTSKRRSDGSGGSGGPADSLASDDRDSGGDDAGATTKESRDALPA